MPEARELRSVIEAADQAASAGDYVAAELALREAAALQEAQLGPFHADLANTLNNLGVIYERADSPAEAELCYRRAYAIATTALEASHPFVATSRKNLEEFCKARGRPFDRSAAPPARVPPRKPVRRSPRPILLSALAAFALAILVAALFWLRSGRSESASTSQTPISAQHEVPLTASGPVEPKREPQQVSSGGNTAAPPASDASVAHGGKSVAAKSGSSAPRASRAPAPAASAPVVVAIAEARLCR